MRKEKIGNADVVSCEILADALCIYFYNLTNIIIITILIILGFYLYPVIKYILIYYFLKQVAKFKPKNYVSSSLESSSQGISFSQERERFSVSIDRQKILMEK